MEELKSVLSEEMDSLKKLLEELDKQHHYIVKDDVLSMEKCSETMQKCNIQIAKLEVKRRDLIGSKSMKEIIQEYKDSELEDLYRNIKKLLNELKVQKETNDLLLRQGLSYINKMITILNPDRNAKTYNHKGKLYK